MVLTSTTGTTYQWFRSGSAISGATNQTYTATTSGTYTVVTTNTNGCASPASNGVVVTVNPLPTATISGTTTVNIGATNPNVTFTATGTAPFIFTYTINGGSNNTLNSSTSSAIIAQTTAAAGVFTYNLVNISDANGCSSAVTGQSATVTVKPTGVNDSYSTSINTTKNYDVRVNDGAAVATATVSISTPPAHGTTSVIADGTVNYVPVTGYIGTDTYKYRLTSNGVTSDEITVTVTVANGIILAQNDAKTVNGTTGDATGLNILANDTYNGIANSATPANVTIAENANNSGGKVKLDVASGIITVDPATPVGTYTIKYTITDKLDNSKTSTADAVITVINGTILAQNDAVTTNGANGGANVLNVFANDTYNGVANSATVNNVTISQNTNNSNGKVTLNTTTGQISVAAGTPVGTYTISYTITDRLDNTKTSQANAVVSVTTGTILAVDDAVTASTAGGVASPNILINDTYNGVANAATTSSVTISEVSNALPGKLTLDVANGTVNVAANTPAGAYVIEYRITDKLDATKSSVAKITVNVSSGNILANNDSGSANGFTGGTAINNVLVNDNVNGGQQATLSNVKIEQVSTTNNNVTIDPATGKVNVAANTAAGSYNVRYRIIDLLDASKTAEAVATVIVNAPALAANNDTGNANSFTGGVAVSNVLTNDTYNGDPATLTTVSLRFVSASDPKITLNTANGNVVVAPKTKAGTYTLNYEIVDKLNPTLSSPASVTVTVGLPTMVAVDDAKSINGLTGGTAIENVLANDSYNGNTATLNEVSLRQVSTSDPKVQLDPATGKVTVTPGTPAGTYTVVYEITDLVNPTEKKTAQVVITVEAPELIANADNGAANSFTGGVAVSNVLANDKYNGNTATLAGVTLSRVSTSDPRVNVDPATGAVNVDPGTPASTYTVVYQITDKINPTLSKQATVTVVVAAAPIVANDDNGTVNGFTGGGAVDNVLANDTYNGNPATLNEVVLSQLTSTSTKVKLDPATGKVNVDPGTAAGTYTLTYRIADKINPGQFKDATVTVTVTAPAIVANADNGTANGFTGDVAVQNVLANDTYNGAPATVANVTLTQVSTTNTNVTLNTTTGAINVAANTPAGSYVVVYRIADQLNPGQFKEASVTVTVTAPAIVANNDSGTINGFTGGKAVDNVLANDSYNGNTALLAEVNLSQISSSDTKVKLDVVTGAVNVDPNTPAGTYTLVYQIQDKVNPIPSQTKTATVTVTVTAPALAANADAGSINGFAGGKAIDNVLANDNYNTGTATLTNVNLSQVSTSNTNVTLDPATGAVNVASGTPAGTYTVVYQIQDKLNPTQTKTANAVVTVNAPDLIAANDAGTANGAAGGVAVNNVLANDTYNGNVATTAVITLTQVSTTNANVTLNPATGAINVAAGTPSGSYSVTYQIADKLNPTLTKTAVATITVDAPALVANDDAGTANGFSGATAIADVLVNDTYNNGPATLNNVNLSQVSTTNNNVTLDPTTGKVNVGANTPAGTYTVVYQIQDKINPAQTKNANAVVTVTAPQIIANADLGTTNGLTGGTAVPNVLTNDTYNGAPATLTNVTLSQVSTTNPNVTLNTSTGAVNVAANTPAGTYNVVYSITDKLNPSQSTTATATITVNAPAMVATADNGNANGFTGGTAVPNVLANDTYNGNPATLNNVTLTQVSSDNAKVKLDPATGAILVEAGTPVGTYTVVYQIEDKLNPGQKTTANVTVTVTAPGILATNDSGSINGFVGGTAVSNVLINDTYNGTTATLNEVNLSLVSTSNPKIKFDVTTGAVNVDPATPAGTYTVEYRIADKVNPTLTSNATATIIVNAPAIVANADNGNANGFTGGKAVPNVLTNDTYNGAPATLTNVTLTQVSTTNTGVTLDPATGAVNVASNTPAGTYTVVYQIEDKLNPGQKTTASVSITVDAPVMNANTDTGTANGFTGGVAVPNVLTNDTYNGVSPASLANVTLTQVSATNPGLSLDPATGAVNVAPNTPAGTYTLVYQIEDKLNPGQTKQASVTVTVGAPALVATNDTGSANGFVGGTAVADVLANDTYNGAPATLTNVTLTQVSTTDAKVTLDPATGKVNVAANTPAGTYTVVYQIEDKLNPGQTKTANVTVTVDPIAIVANGDSGSANGFTGGTAVPNVLANDTYNGAPANLTELTLTQVSTTNTGVTLDPATGAVNVAPNTPAGTYTVVYQVEDKLNPGQTKQASVTVTVTAPVMNANTDTGTANGFTGGVAVPNVLTNDTYNGVSPASLANVTLTQVSASNPGLSLDPATGAVNVAPNTPAGTYTLVYQIEDKLNPGQTKQASVTVTVGAPALVATNDTGSANGFVGGTAVADVLANDTYNGAPATLTNVTLTQVSTTNAKVTLDPATGKVNVAANTPAGTYTVVYQIEDKLNPGQTKTANVTVTVDPIAIVANGDSGSANGFTGGTAVPNVLANDTYNGAPANLTELTQVSTTNTGVTLDPATGAVNVAPNTPAGTYTVVYQVEDKLNPGQTKQASVTVTVNAPVMNANTDTGTANGFTGGVAVPNVLTNDTYNGVSPASLANVTLTQVSASNPGLSLDPATGAVNVAPNTPAGTYTLVYQIEDKLNPGQTKQASVTVTVGAPALVATNDTGSANGFIGGTAVADVLANDTYNGAPATLTNVSLTQVSTTNAKVTLDPATGKVNVAANTPAGTYTVVYQIEDKLNPGQAKTANVTVTVDPISIVANGDSGSANGFTGGTAVPNVLANDTYNGAPANLTELTLTQVSTTNTGVTLDPATGAVNVAANTPAGTYTVVYQVEDKLNPGQTKQASVTVTVNAPVMNANTDTGSANGFTGGVAVPNVLTNDTYNGVSPASLANVTLTQVSATNPGLSLDPATGAVNVAPNTPAGTYTLVYQIEDKLNPGQTKQGTVTVTVGVPAIAATDDAAAINGISGGTAVADVLANDTYNGAAATLTNLNITQISTSNPGVTLEVATGKINVAAGTPEGTYTLIYEIQDKLNPANVDRATVTVTVTAAPMVAVDDNGTVNGFTGGLAVQNVLTNDLFNNAPANTAGVEIKLISTQASIQLDTTTGAVTVPAGTPVGNYVLVYSITDKINANEVRQANVLVTVAAPEMAANPDNGAINGVNGGVAIPNVLTNDTYNGIQATTGTVTLAQITTTDPNVNLNLTNGEISVNSRTKAGTYVVTYDIIDKLNPTLTQRTTATVVVDAPIMTAIGDTGSANGFVGGVAVPNVLANDMYNGSPATLSLVNIKEISSANTGVKLDPATGAVNVAANTPAGTYNLVYEIEDKVNPGSTKQATVVVTVGAPNLVASNDAGAANGFAGGTAVPNVLANDTYNGATATLTNINLTEISSDQPGVKLNVTTGQVTVAANTPRGTYNLVYQIEDKLNPGLTKQATVVVNVDAPVMVANADNGAINGITGGVAIPNVLVNDTYDGAQATLSTVSLVQNATTDTNVNLDVATGEVKVNPNTKAGTYVVTYDIVDRLNPTLTQSTTATVTVDAPVIIANGDTGSANGFVGGIAVPNVLANDMYNGSTATLTNVNLKQISTSNPKVHLDVTTGQVVVDPSTPANTYTVNYEIEDKINSGLTKQATVTVTVNAATMVAYEDTGSANGFTGGVAVPNVLANDSYNGAPATLSNVNLSEISSTNTGVKLNLTTGEVMVDPGTAAGTYSLVYQIEDSLNPGTTKLATVVVTVNAPIMVAVADKGAVNGVTGGVAIPNVLVNDTYNVGQATIANVTLSQFATTDPKVTLNITNGAVSVDPATKSGTYVVTYDIIDKLNPTLTQRTTATVVVDAPIMVANADIGSANGFTGGTAVPNVLANDSYNGGPATLTNVNLTEVSSTNPGIKLDLTTGAVIIEANTHAGTYNLVYQIEDKINPGITKTATVTITVGAPVMAVADDAGAANGFTGGTAVANVLANDTYNGAPASLTNVTLTQVSTGNTGVKLNTATGVVTVDANTKAGTYNLVYTITDKLNPALTEQATVIVTVNTPEMIANADNGAVNGLAGGAAITNVLTNDTYNGAAATLANVKLTQESTTDPKVTLDVATGTVNVLPNTKAGTYTVVYKIEDLLNPGVTKTATATVVVNAPVMVATADNGTANGFTGGTIVENVLANDTYNGAPATLSNVKLTQISTDNPALTLDAATGKVSLAPNTPAGTYTLVYQIEDLLNPGLNKTASVTVTVNAPVLAANADSGTANAYAGGTAVANVLANDTYNGNPATLANVTLTQVSTSNQNVTLDTTTGAVKVQPNTQVGTYTLVYKIEDKLNPGQTQNATVTVDVLAPVMVANANTGSINGLTGGAAIANVLANDTYDGALATFTQVNLSQVSTSNPNVTLNATTGAVNVLPNTPAGTYTLVYRIEDKLNPGQFVTATVTVIVTAPDLIATSDTGSANATNGGTAVENVLANDTYNGAPATLVNVNLSQVSTTNPQVTLDVTTGKVNVAPNTPAGVYTITYQIEDKLNPGQTKTTSVTVTVTSGTILANDDSGTINGAIGGTALANVLANDTYNNGVQATINNVTIVQLSTTNSKISINPLTGAVNVLAGTLPGTYTLQYQITDKLDAAKSSTAVVTITIQNSAPVVTAPAITTNEDTPVNGKITATDADGDPLTFTLVTPPAHGTLVLNPDGTYTYTPNADYNGTDSFVVTVSDGKGGTTTVTINVTVTAVNDVPVATTPVNVTTTKNTPVTGKVTATDVDGDPLTYSVGTPPANGTVVVNPDGTFTYTPNNNYSGTDSFTVVVSDGKGGTTTVTVNVNIAPTNVAPVVTAPAITTNEDTPVNGKITATDADGDPLTFTLVTPPAHGTLVLNPDGTYTYTPNANYNGTDSFVVTVSDGKGGTTTVTINVTVTAVNDVPVATSPAITTPMNTPKTGVVTASDVDGDTLTFTVSTAPAHGTVVVNADGTYTYTPATGYTGTDSFTITVSDGKGGTTTVTIPVTVTLVAAPTLRLTKEATNTVSKVGDIINYNIIVTNTGNVTLTNVAVADAGADAGSIIPASVASLAPGASVTVTARHTVTLTEVNNGSFSNQASVTANTPGGGTITKEKSDNPATPAVDDATVTVISPASTIALVKTGTVSADGNSITYNFSIRNTGNVTLHVITLVDAKLGLTRTLSGNLAPGASATESFTYQLTQADKDAGSVTNTATVTARTPANLPVSDVSGTAENNDTPTVTSFSVNGAIALVKTATFDGNKVTYTFTIKNTGPVTLNTITLTDAKLGLNNKVITVANGLAPGAITTAVEVYTLTQADKDLGTVTNTATVNAKTIGGANVTDVSGTLENNNTPTVISFPKSPRAVNDDGGIVSGSPKTIIVLANDDPGNSTFDKLTVEIVSQPKNGKVVVNADGTITYTANPGFTGEDTFTYRVKDAYGYYTNVASVTLTATFVNISVPNLFTPNGDGINDVFEIRGLNQYQSNELQIVNRWGNEVFHAKGYQNNWTGEGLNEGTYYYLLRVKKAGSDEMEVFKGYITLIRAFKN
ncbi:MAG: tandem-95 repeat protein [Sphingobacteriales bacterium]|nr:MAG: tandem-95 repeat protein [Sphingobacteriales bacterium]